jgi:6-phosphofructokinase 1
MKKIGVLTSGGDVPRMNAAVRAVVRTGIANGLEIIGVMEGFNGLSKDLFKQLNACDVSNVLQLGGRILRSARSEAVRISKRRKQAFENIKKEGLEGLIIIGGNASFAGASVFSSEYSVPYIGVPRTIDNDLFGTDSTLDFDTACNAVLEAVNRIKDTATSNNRLFFIEVMGRDSRYIALTTFIATGAEEILLPETATNLDQLIARL